MLRDRDLVPSPKKKSGPQNILLLIGLALISSVILRFIIHAYFFFPVKVTTEQMAPALKPGDKVYVHLRVTPAEIKRGDILLLRHPENPDWHMFRRVLGLAGDRVRLENGQVLVNGKRLNQAWEKELKKTPGGARDRELPEAIFPRDNLSTVKVKPGHFFVMGDNRRISIDSRQLGPLSAERIVGVLGE